MNKRYVLVTAAKNEGENLLKLVQAVAEQTIKPVLWVIADDGSTDNTPEIINEAMRKYKWIQSIRLNSKNNVRDIGIHLSWVMMEVTKFATEYCKARRIDYEYIGNVDGDITIERAFFEKLMKEFEKDPKLGIAGSGTQYIKGDEIIQPEGNEEEPSGGDMLIRRECFEDCKDVIYSAPSWDSVLKAKARLRGWKTRRFEYVKAIETRDPIITFEGYWKGYIQHGEGSYMINLNPIHVLIKTVRYLCKKPYYIGIAYLLGYLKGAIRGKKIEDEEIRKYFWNKWKKYLYGEQTRNPKPRSSK